ncbi:MAG: hypothetical protein V3V88_03645 [Dehalococcoidia bacterium]
MIRILDDHFVADWGVFTWYYEGELIEQVQVLLFNGMLLIIDMEDFLMISDDGGF